MSNVIIKSIRFSSGKLETKNRTEITIDTGFKKIISVYVSRTLSDVSLGYFVYEYANVKQINDNIVTLEFENSGPAPIGIEGNLLVTGIE